MLTCRAPGPHPAHASAQTPDPAQSAHHRPHLPWWAAVCSR